MPKFVAALCALLVGLLIPPSAGANEASDVATGSGQGSLVGRVSASDVPLGDVAVYAYQLADLSLDRSATDREGKFSFSSLPAGLYKIIAYKPGFVPAVVLLTRATASTYQFLDFELSEEQLAKESDGSDFWSVRGRIPRDVLREIRLAEWQAPESEPLDRPDFSAKMQALAGVGKNAQLGNSQLTDAQVGLEGRVGALELDLQGRLRELQPNALSAQRLDGEARSQAISLSLRSENQARFDFVSEQSTLSGVQAPMDLRHYGVSWSQPFGPAGRSRFTASYTDENNFYRDGSLDPLDLPAASRTLHVEGSYEATVSEHSFRTGVRYRQRLLAVPEMNTYGGGLPYERIDLFGLDGWTVLPTVIVEYGLFSTLADGSLSLTPHGGLVVDLNKNWTAAGVIRQRLSEEDTDERMRDFVPMSYAQSADCGTTEKHCYRLELSRQLGSEEERFTVGALHREFADTLRLYFNQDFFNQLESLFLVRGDQVPELKLAISQRLGRNVIAELQSSVGSGGGGVFQAADARSYQNQVRYVATSLNTEFESTSTGLLLAFHRIEQELQPMSSAADPTTPMAMDRLQILLTQDLDSILHMATDLALLLDMQFSRGSTLYDDLPSDELRHQVVGGVAVKF